MAGALVATLALGTALDANAKRMGSSRSIGKQSSTVTQRQQTPPATTTSPTQQAAPAAQPSPAAPAPSPAQQPRRNWGGMLGGLAAGLGLGYLLSKFGLGAGLASFLSNLILIALVAFVVMWIIRKVRGNRPQGPAYATGGPSLGGDREPYMPQPAAPAPQATAPAGSALNTGNASGLGAGAPTAAQSWSLGGPAEPALNAQAAPAASPQPWGVPADFDTQAFLRNAKVYFIRLQAAWDAGNLNDIREFTTPEMFAEIKMDLADRGAAPNKTDVVSVDAEMLGIETHPTEYLASVRFSGMIREEANAPAQPFAEVWNLSKPTQGSGGWVLAGIQQLQ
jgi:predicted lipid-binding transport protein (Tim44 family)